jgi:hypothetical protein
MVPVSAHYSAKKIVAIINPNGRKSCWLLQASHGLPLEDLGARLTSASNIETSQY